MAKVVGDIAVQVGADVSNLQAGMRRAGRSIEGFDQRAQRMAVNFAKVSAAVAVSVAAATAGIARMAASAAETAAELNNLSRLTGVGVEEFQRLSIAAESVGLSQEKVADIFKDVNDKFGDFLATGAGPLADFFENIAPQVGVTAEQFARLSGPQALQLYVDSLERAGASQQELTFYMEALASDATALLPLLQNGGIELRRLGDEASRAGQIMSAETVRGGVELDATMRDLSRGLRNEMNTALIALQDELAILAQFVEDMVIPAIESMIRAAARGAEALQKMADLVAFIRDPGNAVGEGVANSIGGSLGIGAGDGIVTDPLAEAMGRQDNGVRMDGETGALSLDVPTGGGSQEAEDQHEASLERLRRRQEELEEVRRSGRDRTEEEERRHQESLLRLEELAQENRHRNASGALGDLAVLMQTGNEKIFKVGKAAAVAQAIVDGHAAAVKAWENGMKAGGPFGGPKLAAAYMAMSLARTGAQIAALKATSYSGGGAASAGGGGATVSAPMAGGGSAQETAGTTFNVQLLGNTFDRQSVRGLIESINQEVEDGATLRAIRTV